MSIASSSLSRHSHLAVAGVIGAVAVIWIACLYSIASQVGDPFPGFFYAPDYIISGFTPQDFSGWQAGLRPWDRIVAVDGQPPREMRRLVQETGVGGVVDYAVTRGDQRLQVAVPTMAFTWNILFRFVPAYIFCGLICVAVGLYVYLRNPATRLHRYLFLYLSSYAGFLLVWEYYLSQNKWAAYVLQLWVAEVCVAGWVFFWSFPADHERRAFLPRWPLSRIFVALAIAAAVYYTALYLLASWLDRPGWWRVYTLSATWVSFLVFGGGTVLNKTLPQLLVIHRSGTPPLTRQQAQVLLVGIGLSLIGFVPLFWAPFAIHLRPLANPQWGGIIATFYPLVVGYAVLRYQLFDLRSVARKGLAYSLLTATLTATFLLLSLAMGYLFQALTGQQSLLVALLPALFVAFLFQPVRGHIQTLVDRVFFRREYEIRQTLVAFSQELNTLCEQGEVVSLVLKTVTDTLGVDKVDLWLSRDGQYYTNVAGSAGTLALESDLVVQLIQGRQPLVPLLGEGSPHFDALCQDGAVLAVPLLAGKKLAGMLTLGQKRSGDRFTADDLDLLTTLAQSTALALDNATLHEERMAILRQQLAQVTAAQEEERRRIARELHDGVGPTLASLSVRLRTVRKLLERDPHRAAEEIEQLADLAQANVRDIRHLIYDLRPAALDELGLVPALRDYLERCQREHRVLVEFSADDGDRLPAPVETALFRVAQEGVNNVLKHAQAGRIHVSLRRDDRCTVLCVSDDGRGFDPHASRPGTHLGLWSMRERIDQIGGHFTVSSAPGQGTTLTAAVPYGDRQGGYGQDPYLDR